MGIWQDLQIAAAGCGSMDDADCTDFLQWALPRLDMRWTGFRKVRGQVCKRIKRRLNELGLEGYSAYRQLLETDPAEWRVLDECCHITISRFFRDRDVFELLRKRILPEVARNAAQNRRPVRIWSAGCASGEEPYTLRILWDLEVVPACPGVSLMILATDIDETMLKRAREGCFEEHSLHDLPPQLVASAFDRSADLLCVRPEHREGITFLYQDLRLDMPSETFDLILNRYVAFTYFALPLQRQILSKTLEHLLPQGYLVIGKHERLPEDLPQLVPIEGTRQIFQLRGHIHGTASVSSGAPPRD
jgi:chemotaxis protein methyltransferase CheR